MAVDTNGNEWCFELKVDGYRLLIHVSDGQARAFTRNEKDVTHSLPELQDIDWPESGDFIFDAEVIASDGTYSSTSSRIGRKAENVERDVGMEFACFDIVLSNGKDVSREPYKKRREMLDRVDAGIEDDRFYVLDVTTSLENAKKYAMEHGYKGIIAKRLDAEYEFGTRSDAWIKVKNQAETVDVVAADFKEGDGRLDGTLGKIVLESADGVPVGKTGSGFSDQQRDEIWENRDTYRGATLEIEGEAFDSGIRFPIFKRWRQDDGEPDDFDRIKSILGGAA